MLLLNMMLSGAALSSKFPSVPVTKPLLGLYFAASWCPDCTGVTPAVAAFDKAQTPDWNLVYISSDRTAEQMTSNVPTEFLTVPFENVEERTELKRHFGACAGSETGPLSVQRKFGLPTLLVIETATGKVISTDGVGDIRKGDAALDYWKSLMES
jgi:nucleoredoxin